MKCCIFNSLPQHHEMFAYVLDYFVKRKMPIDTYTNTTNNYGWLQFYERAFSVITWFPISFFNPNAYDYVFVLTDDDNGYTPFWNSTARVIVVEHNGKRQLKLNSYYTLQTREFKLRSPPSDPATWVLPVWNNPFYKKFDELTVLSIGNASNRINLPSLFKNFNDIQFILIDRHMNVHSDKPNITRYNSLDASKLVEFAGRAHYIVFWPTTSFSQDHKDTSMSGSFPLAYSVGTPLIMPESFIHPLGLDGIVGIEDSIHLEKPSENLYSRFLVQREKLLERRDTVFDLIVKDKQ